MPIGDIKVDFGGLDAGATAISNEAKKIEQELSDLKQRLAPLVAGWTGEASENYQMYQREWDQSAAALQQVLAQIGVALRTANEDYRDGERNNASRFL